MLGTALLFLLAAFDPTARDVPAPVADIVVRAQRTREAVILRELDTRPGQRFSPERWRSDVQRLKDLGIFWSVDTTAETRPGGVVLYLNVRDKWTLIPSFGFTASDVFEWYAGLYEANLFGFHTELGFQFDQKSGGNGYQVWHYNWRVRYTDLYYLLEAHDRSTFHPVYDQEAPANTLDGTFETRSRFLYLEVGRRIGDPLRRIGLVFQPGFSDYSLVERTAEDRALHRETGFRTPPSRFLNRYGVRLQWGQPHEDDYIFQGAGLTAQWLTAFHGIFTRHQYNRLHADFRHLFQLVGRHNAGYRVVVGRTSSTALEDAFTVGGLHEVRGFPDERFYGQNVWYYNLEYRYPALDTSWLLGQVAIFSDGGRTWDGEWFSYDAIDPARLAVATGAGVRLKLKPILSTFLRIDYALAWRPYRTSGLSVGVSQFF